jgi:large subunit ribosomal protein L23
MDIYHTIIRPLVTEKSTHQSQAKSEKEGKDKKGAKAKSAKPAKAAERGGTYAFQVHPRATKPQIRDAVEKIYNVRVMDVRTMNCESKARRFRFRVGHKEHTKKAIVVVDPNSHIDLF